MTKLSVNINKIATLRNARGGNVPDVIRVALDCERFGAQGITVHPRPDERHIRYRDVFELQPMPQIILLVGLDEIMTCYLSGHQLDETAQKFCADIINNDMRIPIKIVSDWPEAYGFAVRPETPQ